MTKRLGGKERKEVGKMGKEERIDDLTFKKGDKIIEFN
jgi:hypothetical protein